MSRDIKSAMTFNRCMRDQYFRDAGTNEICDIIETALQKYDPGDPVINESAGIYECPACGAIYSVRQKHYYCSTCGKRFNWIKE